MGTCTWGNGGAYRVGHLGASRERYAKSSRSVSVGAGRVRGHLHPERTRYSRDATRDPPKPDEPEPLSAQFMRGAGWRLEPSALTQGTVSCWDGARRREEVRKCQLDDGPGGRARRVQHPKRANRPRRANVNIVNADAGAAHDAKVAGGAALKRAAGERSGRADDDGVELRERAAVQLALRERALCHARAVG